MKANLTLTQINYQADTILIAVSNDIINYNLQESFQPSFNVLSVQDGNEAFDMAIKDTPSLIILDISLTGLNAFALCEKLKTNSVTNHMPVIILTNKKETETTVRGFAVGADDLIAKPYCTIEMKARICNLISNRTKLRNHFERQFHLSANLVNFQSIEEKFIGTVIEVAVKNVGDPQFNVNKFAREVGVSNAQLYRKLYSLTGLSPNDFIRNIRLERAAQLLSRHTGNISEVAYQVGFSNLSYFSKCFRGKFGVIPSGFLKNKTAYPLALKPRLPLGYDLTGSTFYSLLA